MRKIYTSPRQDNIDRVIALMAEHGIETLVSNRSNYNRPTWERFSYTPRRNDRHDWPLVWIVRADDYAEARIILRGIGIEPLIRHGDELAAVRNPTPEMRRRHTVTRVRRIVLVALLGVLALMALRFTQVI